MWSWTPRVLNMAACWPMKDDTVAGENRGRGGAEGRDVLVKDGVDKAIALGEANQAMGRGFQAL